jgi:hypothetical protein
LTLRKSLEIQEANASDVTGNKKHGLKKGHSSTTLSIKVYSLIAKALDEDKFVLVLSLDLSSVFDVVDIDLLIKY